MVVSTNQRLTELSEHDEGGDITYWEGYPGRFSLDASILALKL